MDLLASVRKEGSRGGVNFSWDDVKSSQHRENYLGHSLMAPVGRWQKGKDLNWYAKADDADLAPEERAERERERKREELRKVKEAEEDAMARALGLPVPDRSNANNEPLGESKMDQKEVNRSSKGALDNGEGRFGSNDSFRDGGRPERGDREYKKAERAGTGHRERHGRSHSRHQDRPGNDDRSSRHRQHRSRSRNRDRDRRHRHRHRRHSLSRSPPTEIRRRHSRSRDRQGGERWRHRKDNDYRSRSPDRGYRRYRSRSRTRSPQDGHRRRNSER